MGWTSNKIVISAFGAIAVGIALAAPAHADDTDKFFSDLRNVPGIEQSWTPDETLSVGQYLCKGLRSGRSFNSVYSDLVDWASGTAQKPRGSLGVIDASAYHNLCPEFLNVGRNNELEYIPKSQRD